MAREPINAGAGTLAAMSENVAKMGALRQQSLAQTSESLNNAARHLQEWQKGYDERKRAKWVQDMETAKLDEQKRTNDANIDLAYKNYELEKELLPTKKKLYENQAWNFGANAGATNQATNTQRKAMEYIEKEQAKQAAEQAAKEATEKNPTPNTQQSTFGAFVNGVKTIAARITPKATAAGNVKPQNNGNDYLTRK